jgi:PIN domain nuclease of toxin-antitoxin system
MPRLLLDTNIVIHIVNGTEGSLPQRLREAIVLEGASFGTSVVSLWEMSIKLAAGKLELGEPLSVVPAMLSGLAVEVLPMSLKHALEVAYPEPATKDPFDRLLLAVCACEGMKLVTTDVRLTGHRLVW